MEELKKLGKPFVILLNTTRPFSDSVRKTAEEKFAKYQVPVLPVNCEQLKKEDISMILEQILLEFPLIEVEFHMPSWVEMLPVEHPAKQEVIRKGKEMMGEFRVLRDVGSVRTDCEGPAIRKIKLEQVALSRGVVIYTVTMEESGYYQMLSELTGMELRDEYDLIGQLKELSAMQRQYGKVIRAMDAVRQKGYGMVLPERDEITMEDPVLIHQGGKYGVKLRAFSPSVHMIRADIETEIAPIVGSEEQAKDLIRYIQEGRAEDDGIWKINIFGKTVEEMVEDGIRSKLYQIGKDMIVNLWNGIKSYISWFKNQITGFAQGLWSGIFGGESSQSTAKTVTPQMQNNGFRIDGSYAKGLSYVPFDGFIAELHKGEMVLTKDQAESYRNETAQSGITVIQNIYSEAKTAADLMREALYEQERAVLIGV